MFEAIAKLSMPNKRLPVLQDAQDSYQQKFADINRNKIKLSSNDAAELKDPGESKFMSLGALLFNSSYISFLVRKHFHQIFIGFFQVNLYLITKIFPLNALHLDLCH